jgi:putative transcriptional regulator
MTERNLFDEIREGLEAARDKERLPHHEVPAPDVEAIRKSFGMSQAQLAKVLGVNRRTLQRWEQGRSVPDGATQTLLRVMEKEPNTVMRVLHPIFRLIGAGHGGGTPGARDKHAILDQ